MSNATDEFRELYESISSDQREMFDFIWSEFVRVGEWPRLSRVVGEVGSLDPLEKWCNELGGDIIDRAHGKGGKIVLRLTFLGVLLTSFSTTLIESLRRFLIIVKHRIEVEKDVGVELQIQNVLREVELSSGDEYPLIRLLEASGCKWGAVNGEEDNWIFETWDGAVELFGVKQQEMNVYIFTVALKHLNRIEDEIYQTTYDESVQTRDGDLVDKEKINGDHKHYMYEVALSFAGEQREYVERVFGYLKDQRIRTFYDDDNEVALWGEDLAEYFDDIYRVKSQYCVMFISTEYAEKPWTIHERRSALARALNDKSAYVLPARFDDTELPGLRSTVGYIDLKNYPDPIEFAKLIIRKIQNTERESHFSDVLEDSGSENDSLYNILGLLLTLKQYADEFDERQIVPGITQLKEAFEINGDRIVELLKDNHVSLIAYSSRLIELADLAEKIGVFEFYMGRNSYVEFAGMLSESTSIINSILAESFSEIANEPALLNDIKESLSSTIQGFTDLTRKINKTDKTILYKRIDKYQSDVCEIGMQFYRVGYLLDGFGNRMQGEKLMEIGDSLHLIEATDGEIDPSNVFEVFDEFDTYCTELHDILKSVQ